jgi:hypothetical protein
LATELTFDVLTGQTVIRDMTDEEIAMLFINQEQPLEGTDETPSPA